MLNYLKNYENIGQANHQESPSGTKTHKQR